MNFDNGYGISVVQGDGLYGDKENNTYEVAFLYNTRILEPTEHTIHGYVSVDEIDVMMEALQTATRCKLQQWILMLLDHINLLYR